MTRLFTRTLHIPMLLMSFAGFSSSYAQEIIFTAKAGSPVIRLQDSVCVHYTIENLVKPKTIAPKAEIKLNFEVIGGPYQSNDKATMFSDSTFLVRTLTISYLLKPKRPGRLTIPKAIAEDANGNTYESNDVSIEVIDDGSLVKKKPKINDLETGNDTLDSKLLETGNALLDSNLFIKVVASKDKVYKREQVIISYKLYALVPFDVDVDKLPLLNDFVKQTFNIPQGKIKPEVESYIGRNYQVFTLMKFAVYPVKVGLLMLDTIQAEGIMRLKERESPYGDNPQNSSYKSQLYRDVPVRIKSLPCAIEVLPHPPDNLPYYAYTGAVGNFVISGNTDKTVYHKNDTINFELIIQGEGELKLIHPPRLRLPGGLISNNQIVIDSSVFHDMSIHNIKKINYAIPASKEGEHSIPTVTFNYFNPQTGKHEAIATKPIRINILK